MRVVDVQLVDFGAKDVERIEPWFDDPETQRWLGGRDWIRRAPSLLQLTIGDEYRGKVVTGRRMWLALDEGGAPVAFVDAEMYDRYAAWDGSDWDHPVVSDVVDVPSMSLSLVVDPSRRSRGYGSTTILALVRHPDLIDIRLFFGSAESDNVASIRCLERSGFVLRSAQPDFEGMLHYSLAR
jgi:RimJ/RimL family protein N-acetyltransferase